MEEQSRATGKGRLQRLQSRNDFDLGMITTLELRRSTNSRVVQRGNSINEQRNAVTHSPAIPIKNAGCRLDTTPPKCGNVSPHFGVRIPVS